MAANARTTAAVGTGTFSPQRAMQGMLPSIVVSGVLPFALYQVLKGHGMATVPALSAGAVFPVASTLVSWGRTRRADIIGLISLFFIAASVTTSLISGDATFTLIKESFLTGLFGLIFLGSLAAPRPLMFYLGCQFSTGGDPQAIVEWNARWEMPGFRTVIRKMSAIWGVVLVLEAAIRVALVFILPISVFLIVSQALVYTVLGVTIHWTMAYGRRMRQRAAAQAEAV